MKKYSTINPIFLLTLGFLIPTSLAYFNTSDRLSKKALKPVKVYTVQEDFGDSSKQRIIEEQERLKQLSCLSYTLYGEARSESPLGQWLVAEIILNRRDSKYYPSTICEVVHQPYQFSMYDDNNIEITHKAFTEYEGEPEYEVIVAIKIAKEVLASKRSERILPKSAYNYHADYVNPPWSTNGKLTLYDQVGDHKFYFKK